MKRISYIFLGILIGVMLTASVGAYAATKGFIGKKISAEYEVYLDGETTHNVGIAVDGKSYLPVRWMADTSGMGVDFKENKIYLENKKEVVTPTDTTITDTEKKGDGMSNEMSVESQLEVINGSIKKIETIMMLNKAALDDPRSNWTTERKTELEEAISGNEKDIAELKAKKAALESK
jgi:hypothetical protein